MARLIDKNALMNQLIDKGALMNLYAENEFSSDMGDAMEMLDHFPTVDTEPVIHGKWLYGESESGHDGYYCSQCGKHIRWIYGEEDINFIRSYNYCPYCGARMDADETD